MREKETFKEFRTRLINWEEGMLRLQETQELNSLLEQENHALKKKNQAVETKIQALGEEGVSLKKENEEIFIKLNEVQGLEHKNQQFQFHI